MTIEEKLKSNEWKKYRKQIPDAKGLGKHYVKDTCKILSIADDFKQMDNQTLQMRARSLQERVKNGEKLDDVKCEAYALMREASRRVLGKEQYPVQVLGACALFDGNIAEMATGEGKTLMALLPTYLYALTGENVHVITANEYLAKRDSEMAGKVFEFLGMTCGVSTASTEENIEENTKKKQKAYEKNITYLTCTEVGFDYLRDNMATKKAQQVLQGCNFAVIDEVDNVLLDEGMTPLVINAGEKNRDGNLLKKADKFVKSLSSKDLEIEPATFFVALTEEGMDRAEKFFDLKGLYGDQDENEESEVDIDRAVVRDYISNALKANYLFEKDREYIVADDKIEIVGGSIGRVLSGREYSGGLHQALQAKEGVTITPERKYGAEITIQGLFDLYKHKCGMTGTASTDAIEFEEGYDMPVVQIPLNRERKREDLGIEVYADQEEKMKAIIAQVEACHEKGQPILIGVTSIKDSLMISRLLKEDGLEHNVLNARIITGINANDQDDKQVQDEDFIVAQAGRKGAITVATNMAGRGTDILLGGNSEFMAREVLLKEGYSEEQIAKAESLIESDDKNVRALQVRFQELRAGFQKQVEQEKKEVEDAGGLFVLGCELNASRRIDDQLKGRSGRSGDKGQTKIVCSLDDRLLKTVLERGELRELQKKYEGEEGAIKSPSLLRYMLTIQRMAEGRESTSRRWSRKFGQGESEIRKKFYSLRHEAFDKKISMQNLYGGMVNFLVREELSLPYSQETYDQSNPRQYVIEKIAEKYGVDKKTLKDAYFLDDKQIADKIAEMVVERDKLLRMHGEEAREGWLERLNGVWSEYLSQTSQMTMTAGLSYIVSTDIAADLAKDQFHLLKKMINACAEKFVIEMPENLKRAEEYKKNQDERREFEKAISGKQTNGSGTKVRNMTIKKGANITSILAQKQEASTEEEKDKKQETTVQGEDESKKSKGTNKNQGFGMD